MQLEFLFFEASGKGTVGVFFIEYTGCYRGSR